MIETIQKAHLQDFKIIGFKKFEMFELNNIGQFNLIIGDNNIGKTSVLEALLIDTNVGVYVNNLLATLVFKGVINQNKSVPDLSIIKNIKLFLNQKLNQNKLEFNLKMNSETQNIILNFFDDFDDYQKKEKILYNLEETENIAQMFKDSFYLSMNSDSNSISQKSFILSSLNNKVKSVFHVPGKINLTNQAYNLPFIPFTKGYGKDLTKYYSEFIQSNKLIKQNFIKNLESLIPNIEDIQLSTSYNSEINDTPILVIIQKNSDTPFPLSMMGEGANKLFRILMEITVHKGKRLMIDEIDTGIHWSRFKKFWKIILNSAKQNEVQIFATTHNLECLKFFKEALEEDEIKELQSDVRSFTLQSLPNNQVKAYTYTFEQFEHSIEQEIEIRGNSDL